MNEAVKIAVSNESLSILDLILQASLLARLVLLIRVAAALVARPAIFTNAHTLKRLRQQEDDCEPDL